MRGNIKSRGKGSWMIRLNIENDPTTGKRRQPTFTVHGTKAMAEKRLAELLLQFADGAYIPTKITANNFFDGWFKDYARPSLAPRTVEGYEHIFRKHIEPSKLGRMLLTEIQPRHVQEFLGSKLESLSPRSVRHIRELLYSGYSNAVRLGLASRNPIDACPPPKFQRKEMRTLSAEDVARVLTAAESGQYHAFFFTAIYTGMRRSELLGLRWGDIDLILGQISVARSLHHLRNGENVVCSPKTDHSRRTIAMSPALQTMFIRHYEAAKGLGITLNQPVTDASWVFCHANGSPLLADSVTHAWEDLMKKLGLKGVRLHDCRHTHATLMLKQGVHPKIVQERLGHSSISVTLDTYSHVTAGLQEVAAQKFDEAVALPAYPRES